MKKKVKKYAAGGLSDIADTAQSLMGQVDDMASQINYGSNAMTKEAQPVGFNAIKGMKKGGSVSSASKRADGAAQRGKTRGRYI